MLITSWNCMWFDCSFCHKRTAPSVSGTYVLRAVKCMRCMAAKWRHWKRKPHGGEMMTSQKNVRRMAAKWWHHRKTHTHTAYCIVPTQYISMYYIVYKDAKSLMHARPPGVQCLNYLAQHFTAFKRLLVRNASSQMAPHIHIKMGNQNTYNFKEIIKV